jgi:glutamate-1-semialdehyde aminotransferase/spore coat polysaccharide biosynthesis protein SpsF (cytidylyltransferase family)
MAKIKFLAITQARSGSSRLPKKVLRKIEGQTLLSIHLERLLQSNYIDKLMVATTVNLADDAICEEAKLSKVDFFRGSEQDVLDRYYQTASVYQPEYVIRLTSDCPLIDAELLDRGIEFFIEKKVDYISNSLTESYPDGQDFEIFTFEALKQAWEKGKETSEREHVTPYIRNHSDFRGGKIFRSLDFPSAVNYNHIRMTVDEESDFQVIEQLVKVLGKNKTWIEYVEYLEKNSQYQFNKNIIRNEGYHKSMMSNHITNFEKSNQHRQIIHDLIPGGAHTYSKGDDQFPLLSPAAVSHGKGAYLWDIDGNKFLDCSMGLTSVTLGHAYEPVLQRVREELEKGTNFQRPSYIEREMAEKFLSLVPCHQMIKFAKNGSIVTTAAVKLARAFTGRKLVAFPYDHPFYSYDDWFIGTTACNRGVPEEFSALSVTYKADDLASLTELFEKYPNQIACVISEPEKNFGLPENYLKNAIDLAHKHGALYIADEMITGFKTDFPGSIKKYNVQPDMTTWGKGIANGFSFCALTGKKEVMELGGIRNTGQEKVFLISTTHGGETHAIAAGLATIAEYQKYDVIKHNQGIGNLFNAKLKQAINKHQLADFIQLTSCDWMPIVIFKNKKGEACQGLRTLVMQEMIKRGVLFQGALVPSFSHQESDMDYLAVAFDETLAVYEKALEDGYEKYLLGEPAKAVFRKYL